MADLRLQHNSFRDIDNHTNNQIDKGCATAWLRPNINDRRTVTEEYANEKPKSTNRLINIRHQLPR